jgi:GntR family transcriptional regulator/MocR family aminotransferase
MGKRPVRVPILNLGLNPRSGLPRHRQLYDGMREAILTGRLVPGGRLPSTRMLALDVGCSRNTVITAFEQLAAEGYLEGRVGAGTTVSKTLPETALRVPEADIPVRRLTNRRRFLSRRGALLLRAYSLQPATSTSRPFRLGLPAMDAASCETWTRLVARWTRKTPRRLLEYGDPAGYRPLREAIATYLREARGVRCTVDEVIVVSGSQQGIDLTARVLLDPGDTVWVEDPCYPAARAAFVTSELRPCAVPVDSEGLQVRIGAARAPGAKLVYVTPSHQFPLGVTMSLSRRLALLEWARQKNAWILEDDHNSQYRYASRPLAALQGLDTEGCVIYVGSFSKVLFPALRLGYAVVPARLVDAFVAARALIDRHSPTGPQAALADFIGEGHFARHIRRNRALYAERQAALVRATRSLAGQLDISPSEAGMHLVGWLPPGTDDRAVSRAAAEHGVETSALSVYRLRSSGPGGLILGYTGFSERELSEGAKALERALHISRGRRITAQR